MKKFLAAAIMLASMNVFSQSYIVLSNGVTLTTDKAGFVYDFNHFRLPYKVSVSGGQFLVEDEKLSTVDANGFLYEKDFKVDDEVKGKGLNYFIMDNNNLVTIDSNGFYYEYDEDARSIFKKATTFGGNFFVATINKRKGQYELYTINEKGNYFKVDVEGLNPENISYAGGKYFQTQDGVTYTVSKDGFVFAKPEIQVGSVVKAGGNFLIDSTNKIFTISDDGLLILPVLPLNIKVETITKVGSNYMIDSEGRLFTVDSLGNIAERTVEHDLTKAKILSL
ncbi:MAG: hypothetical protein ACLGHN_10145 [Bacteriovoracia bacterium]